MLHVQCDLVCSWTVMESAGSNFILPHAEWMFISCPISVSRKHCNTELAKHKFILAGFVNPLYGFGSVKVICQNW